MSDKFEITKLDVFHIAENIPLKKLDSSSASSGQIPIFNEKVSAAEWSYIDSGSPSASFTLSQLRRGTKEEWESVNPILNDGEIGLEIDGLNRNFKIGDGVTHWKELSYNQEYYFAGIIKNNPSVTANNGPSPSVTITDCQVVLYDNPSGSGVPKTYLLTGGTFPVVDNSVNYLYAHYNNGNPEIAITTDRSIYTDTDVIPINTLMVSNGYIHLSHWDKTGEALPNKIHKRLVNTQRHAYESGLEIIYENNTVKINSGRVWRGARCFDLQDTYSNGFNNSMWFKYYHDSNGVWISEVVTSAPFDYQNYDSVTSGLTPLPSDLPYVINWVFRGVEDHQHGYYILSNTGYKDLPTAIAVTRIPNIPLTITSHAILVGRIICQKGNPVPVLIESAFTNQFIGSIINEHNQLGGLQGGNDGFEQYHLTQAHWSNLTSLYPQFDGIQFNTNPSSITHQPGLLHWDSDSGTLELGMNIPGVRQQIGLESYVFVENKSGVLIPNGAVVYLSGDAGNRPGVRLAIANSESTSEKVIGVATHDIPNNGVGYVTTQGIVNELNTSNFNPGDMLWLSPTIPGGLTNIRPNAPFHAVFIGVILIKHSTQGNIFVNPQNGYEISELHDVLINNIKNDDILLWSDSSSAFVNSDILSGKESYHGFVDRISTSLLFNDSTTTFTLSGSNYFVYFDGKKFIGNTLSVTLSASPAWGDGVINPLGQWFIWLNKNGLLECSKTPWDLLNFDIVPVATVYIQQGISTPFTGIIAEERHGYKRNLIWHDHAHNTYGTQYVTGFTTSPIFLSNNTFSFPGGIIADEDIQNSSLGTQNTCRIGYRRITTGPNGTVTRLYFDPVSGNRFARVNASGQILYDNNGVLTPLTSNSQYGVYWIYATNRLTTPIISIMGQGVYGSVAQAQAAPYPDLAGLSVAEWKLLYRVIVRGANNSFSVASVDVLYNTSTGPVIQAIPPANIAASNVSLIPTGDISSTDVQSAIQELDSEKSPLIHTHTISDIINFPNYEWVRELFVVSNPLQRDYVLSNNIIPNSETLDVNGLVLVNDPNWDYIIINNNTIRFNSAVILNIGMRIQIKYQIIK